MRIIIDAMGGDNAPAEIVAGAARAAPELDVDVILVGREEPVRACLAKCPGGKSDRIRVVHAPDVIDMHDDPSTATRIKKEASMTVALRMLAEGEGDAVVSAGSTGALLTGATLIARRIQGIRRAAMAPVLPNGQKGVLLIDCGANVECTAEYLLQFAYMGSFYSRNILGCDSPRVGLLNVGTEDTKGGELQKQVYALLTEAHQAGRICFVGNVEARDTFSGQVDVLVTDGFTGNVLLKGIEGSAMFIMKNLKLALMSSKRSKLGALLAGSQIQKLKTLFDAGEVGGTPMLGISRAVIKAHGASDARAIVSAVRQAKAFVEADVIGEIAKNIEYMKTV